MPRYDVRCRACGATFEINRPMDRAGDPAPCPHGHDDTVRLLPTVGLTGRAATGRSLAGPSGSAISAAASGGCCGGACGCG